MADEDHGRRSNSSKTSSKGSSQSLSSRRRRRHHAKRPIDVSKRIIPWDGTIPNAKNSILRKHWLFPSRNRPVVLNPFDRTKNDVEPDPPQFPYQHPLPIENAPHRFMNIYAPD